MELFPVKEATPLQNEQYYYRLCEAIDNCISRFWAAQFSINLMYSNDDILRTRKLIEKLQKATHRRVDVRILMGAGTEQTDAFDTSNQMSYTFIKNTGVPIRFFNSDFKKSSHSKYVLVDKELTILGSHNWGHRSLRVGQDDSIELKAEGFNKFLEYDFLTNWNYGL